MTITAKTDEAITLAFERIAQIVAECESRGGAPPPKPTAVVGQTYKSEVKSIMPFGIFVELLPGLDGFCHISEISDTFVRKIEEVGLAVGDIIEVQVTTKNEKGQYRVKRILPGAAAADGAPAAGAEGAAPPPTKRGAGGGGGARGSSGPRRTGDVKTETAPAVAEAALSAALGGLSDEASE